MSNVLLCSDCFRDHGLRFNADQMGAADGSRCPNCLSETGAKLNKEDLEALAYGFFVLGSLVRLDYGAAPRVQFNKHQTTDIEVPPWLERDLRTIENALGVGFFHYGPRLWMVGDIKPLNDLRRRQTRPAIIRRILEEYPSVYLNTDQLFYRLRKAPANPENPGEYDTPPRTRAGSGRLDSTALPVMYSSQDLQICIHECRVTAEDEIYVATLSPSQELKLLDLSALIQDEDTEFESLDLAVHMLFLAGDYSYPISRQIAVAAHEAGFDGISYPSYFSLLRTGGMPFETAYGISLRKLPQVRKRELEKIIPNFALFGRPIGQNKVTVQSINKLVLNKVEYRAFFGPVGC